MPTTADDFLHMSQQELDDLFRASPPGPIPTGDATGTAIIGPHTSLAEIAAEVVSGLAWQGKVFDPVTKTLKNKVSVAGIHAIVADVYEAPSWFDEKPCIVLDYSKTSTVAHWVRDEIREVRPQLYLGIVYIRKDKTINFALDFSPDRPKALGVWQRLTAGLGRLFRRTPR